MRFTKLAYNNYKMFNISSSELLLFRNVPAMNDPSTIRNEWICFFFFAFCEIDCA